MEFRTLMSLGPECRSRYQVERILSARHPELPQPAHFFDWLGPIHGMADYVSVIDDDFSLRREDFIAVPRETFVRVYDDRHGIYFSHHFTYRRAPSDYTAEELDRVLSQQFPAFEAKMAHVAQSTRAALADHAGTALVHSGELTVDDVEALSRVLVSRYGGAPRIIHLPDTALGQASPEHPWVIARPIDQTSDGWHGPDDRWDAAFADIDVAAPRRGRLGRLMRAGR